MMLAVNGLALPVAATPLEQTTLTAQETDEDAAASEQFLEILRRTLGVPQETDQDAAVLEQAAALNQQIVELYQAGRYLEAIPLAEEALSLNRERLGARHRAVATNLNNLARLYVELGRYDEAQPLYQEAIAILREQLGERHSDVALSLNNLAGLYKNQGRFSEAEALYQETIAIFREQLGDYHQNVALGLNNLALLYQTQGRYTEAESLYQEAIAIRLELFGERHITLATPLSNLALLYWEQGRYEEAEPLHKESLSILREQWGDHHPSVGIGLDNLAELYRVQGRYDEAEPLFKEAQVILREYLGERHPDVAINLGHLAGVHQIQGRYEEAEQHYLEAIDILQEALGERHPVVAVSLNNLAVLYRIQGRYQEAENLYQEALDIRQEQLGERHPVVAATLNNLSTLYRTRMDTGRALDYLQKALEIEEHILSLNLISLTEAQRQDFAAAVDSTTRAISLSIEVPEALPLGLSTLLRRKGRLLEVGSNSSQALRQNLDEESQSLLDNLANIRQSLSKLIFSPPTNLSSEQYLTEITRLEQQSEDIEKKISQRSAVFRAESQPVELANVQAQIPADGILLEYALYQPFNISDQSIWWGDPRYAAYLLFPNGRIEVVDLGDAAEIDTAVQSFVRLLQNRNAEFKRTGARPRLREVDIEQVTSNVKELVFDPIAPYLQDTNHLLISPDGQLNLLPFEALQTEAGGDYLVQQYQISYLNSGRDLLKFDVIEPSQNPAVIVANPDYETADFLPQGDAIANDSAQPAVAVAPRAESMGDNRRSTELSQLNEFAPLPGTAAEAEAIRPLLPNAVIRTESDATENLLKSVESPRILHIATHGFFLPNVDRPNPSGQRGISVIASDNPFATAVTPGVVVENPLLRSGLALAGFNTRTSGSEDGVFTALEASQLNLFGTQLVVLSACDTGLGDIANGEGVYGLRRAFALAGAETQLLSLWQVDDFGTQSLMARYYENLTAGMGRSEALREVQLEMIEQGGEYSHPYYWAAFVLTGDWRPLE
ncbi:MAG: tetratricopeptide repeat protein [Leptolyngbya sp. SIOISBB]|nr:tetratricopeptide repeat protein [Leptolyngbya sp. SIOISBB]